MDTTYDVRVYKTEVYRGTRVSSHKVRWKTGSRTWKTTRDPAARRSRGILASPSLTLESFVRRRVDTGSASLLG